MCVGGVTPFGRRKKKNRLGGRAGATLGRTRAAGEGLGAVALELRLAGQGRRSGRVPPQGHPPPFGRPGAGSTGPAPLLPFCPLPAPALLILT